MGFLRSSFAAIWFWSLGTSAFGEPDAAQPPLRQTQPNQGSLLLGRARAALSGHKTISAKIHQRIHLYGQELVGTGVFVQGPPERYQLRLDLNIKVDGQDCYLQQRCDGEYFWLQKFEDGVPKLIRIDVKRVEAARARANSRRGEVAGAKATLGKPSLPMLGLGGMAYLIDQLDAWCVFPKVREAKLPGPEGLTVWVLEGTWRRERLLHWLPDQKDAVDKGAPIKLTKLPAMLPDRIVIFLGRDDLFPRRIEYSASESRLLDDGEAPPLVRVHFDNIQFDQAVDEWQFQFNSAVALPIDDTDGYLLRRGWVIDAKR